jgi:hypothetical protein
MIANTRSDLWPPFWLHDPLHKRGGLKALNSRAFSQVQTNIYTQPTIPVISDPCSQNYLTKEQEDRHRLTLDTNGDEIRNVLPFHRLEAPGEIFYARSCRTRSGSLAHVSVLIFALILHLSGKDRLLLASHGKGKTSSNSVAFWVRRDGLGRGYFDSWIAE